MPNESVQLKQEDLVGSEIVLSDIYPKTSTKSVDDSATGLSLDQTLELMWNSINNKLSRIVNSVNGRTGVVVLRSDDVGLGNVDNVSFSDIKQWVIDQLNQEFGHKRIKLFDYMDEVVEIVTQNDSVNQNAMFFSSNGFRASNDKKSYIGYIFLDQGTNKLAYMYKQLNTVGFTDNSIIYDEQVNDKDMTGGGLGVNIYKYEDALEIYNAMSGNKEESGLRINKEKIVAKLYYFNGVYGDGTLNDENALLYTNDNTSEEAVNANTVILYFDDNPMTKMRIREHGFKIGDIIICNFKDYRDENGNVPSNMFSGLLGRSTCIGMITQVPSEELGTNQYIIKMYSFKHNIGYGLQLRPWGTSNNQLDEQITLKLATGHRNGVLSNTNFSGLQVYPSKYTPDPRNVNESIPLVDFITHQTVLPEGSAQVFQDISKSDGGLMFTPDMSLCVMPLAGYGPSGETNGINSKLVDNWVTLTPSSVNDVSGNAPLEDTCLVGINLLKAVSKGERELEKATVSGNEPAYSLKFANASGLRISNSSQTMNVDFLGMHGLPHRDDNGKALDMTYYGDQTGGVPFESQTSGGLSVNVGKFLEISPGDFPEDSTTFYDGGKINVRIGKGLTEEEDSNRITLKLDNENGGLGFDEAGNLIIKNFKPTVDFQVQSLKISDQLGNSITYNPSQTEVENQKVFEIMLGPGFKIE